MREKIVPEMKTAYRARSEITEYSGMAHCGRQHREAARRDELQEFEHQFRLEKLPSSLDSVRCVKRKSSSWRNSTRADGILQLKMCIITVAAMACSCRSQSNSGFSFDRNFVTSDFATLQDARMSSGEISLNLKGAYEDTSTRGRVLYSRPVQFLEPATKSVASFQTSFSFAIFAKNLANKGHGFAFGLFPDVTAIGDSGEFMGILPFVNGSNDLPPGFNHTFVVEFDTHQDIQFRDVSDNHVGVNWNSMESLNATDLSALGLNLTSGNFTAWIDYSHPFRKLSVWLIRSVLNPVLNMTDPPVLEVTDLDLSQRLLPSMYVGFSGGIGVRTNQLHAITSWSFNSSLIYSDPAAAVPVSSLKASNKDCGADCKRMRRVMISMVVFLGLAVCLVAVSAFCFFRWRRRKAAEAAMILKLNHTFQGPPPQERQPYTAPRSPLGFTHSLNSPRVSSSLNPLKSAHASLSSKPSNSRGAAVRSKFPLSPRASANPFTTRRDSSLRKILSSMDPSTLRHKHSRTSSFGSKRFTSTQELDAVSSLGPRRYTYRELKLATNGFKEELGRGGFGVVYKGYLSDHSEAGIPVAVKEVSADSGQGEREFLAEVNIIAGLRHRHLVQMQGWCHKKGKLLLIYDFMENGSLDKHLYGTNDGNPVLSWDVRYKALRQVAGALTYLHDEAEQKIIHRDVKASNVLLDSKFNARLGDFGLARLSDHSQAVTDTTTMAGTMGYLAPEIVHTGRATTKTDVFSYGTLILEVMCAKRPLDCSRPEEEAILADWVWGLLAAGRLLDAVDPLLLGRYDETAMTRALKVGLMCLHPDYTCRPPIRYALQMLLGDLALPTLPRNKPKSLFSSRTLQIPMRLLLESSMGTIADAMESSGTTTTALSAADFEAPWMPEQDLRQDLCY